jgi:DNA-binding CsgD family transcriptional regulator
MSAFLSIGSRLPATLSVCEVDSDRQIAPVALKLSERLGKEKCGSHCAGNRSFRTTDLGGFGKAAPGSQSGFCSFHQARRESIPHLAIPAEALRAAALLDMLRLLARGLTNADISTRLHLSEGTVRNHVSAIFAKLDVSGRTQAAVIAIQHGLRSG